MQLDAMPDSPLVIQLDDVKSVDFDAFLSVLYPQYVYLSQHQARDSSSSLFLETSTPSKDVLLKNGLLS